MSASWESLRVAREPVTPVKARCRNGHPYTNENLYVRPDGTYLCRRCRRNQLRRHYVNRRVGWNVGALLEYLAETEATC